ncbi:MAG: hypothetical protein HY663_03975 [Chloroflexi bacterium]|nr:hypothetical protein [Chloroflexota bacterium]
MSQQESKSQQSQQEHKLQENPRDGENAENLRVLLKEHADHSRHLENERTGLLFAYIGSTASIIGLTYSLGAKYLGANARLILVIPILLTLVTFLLTKRWSQAFETHEGMVDNIIIKLGYPEYGMDVPANWFFKYARTRRLFYSFYVLILALLILLIVFLPPGMFEVP